MKRIIIDTDKCNGCGLCELVCAVERTGAWHPSLAKIKISKDEQGLLNSPVVCAHCAEAPCMTACLMNIINKDNACDLTVRAEDKCIGCRACQVSCPFDACTYDYLTGRVTSCDLCGGAPACVEVCPTGALRYDTIVLQNEEQRRKLVRTLIREENLDD